MHESQRNLFCLLWYRKNDFDEGKVQLYRFTRHVWGINSSPYIALFAIEKLIAENPTNAGSMILTAIENNRCVVDLLLASTRSMTLKKFLAKQSRCLKVEILNCANRLLMAVLKLFCLESRSVISVQISRRYI